jgi:hypothetical protein
MEMTRHEAVGANPTSVRSNWDLVVFRRCYGVLGCSQPRGHAVE